VLLQLSLHCAKLFHARQLLDVAAVRLGVGVVADLSKRLAGIVLEKLTESGVVDQPADQTCSSFGSNLAFCGSYVVHCGPSKGG